MFHGINALIFHCIVIQAYIIYVSCCYNDIGQLDKVGLRKNFKLFRCSI